MVKLRVINKVGYTGKVELLEDESCPICTAMMQKADVLCEDSEAFLYTEYQCSQCEYFYYGDDYYTM